MDYQNILYSIKDNVAEIVLNRPDKMNSLDETLITELAKIFDDINDEDEIKVVVLSGAGGNFCSGLFLEYLQKISTYDYDQNRTDSVRFKNMLLSIHNCTKPVIAKVSGYALAGGCGIATGCDFIIADDTSKFGYTEVKIGFIPAIVMKFLLKRVLESHAIELLFTGKIIDAQEAFRIGLVNQVVKKEDLDNAVNELTQLLLKNSDSSIKLTKEMLRNISEMSIDNALDYATNLNASIRMTQEFKKGLASFLDRNKK